MVDHWYRVEMLRAVVGGVSAAVCLLALTLLVLFLRWTRS